LVGWVGWVGWVRLTKELAGKEAQHLEILRFRQRQFKAYWIGFLDKGNARRAQLELNVFLPDFLIQIAQRGDIE
jgi:hypothetical protein|tara:strand:+ start:2158 stop:2379 length:222 start_codon:yes stop_codon:yes gene_type:complete